MNICNPKEYSILEIATIIRDAFDKNIPMEFNSSKPDGQFRKPASIEIFQQHYPSYNFISLEEGIKQTVKWYKENKEK
jgi:GDP-L-fucose synthase